MWTDYIQVTTIEEALKILAERGEQARIVAGATDLILEMERGVRKGIDTLIDITRVPGLEKITLDEVDNIHLGPLVTHNHCVASKLIFGYGLPLALAAWEVGAPQIRNRGTVAGNLITASPANDTITPLEALGAKVTLRSLRGERTVALKDFYLGVRKTVMKPDEVMVDIAFPGLKPNQRGAFQKLGLRRAQAIALVNASIVLDFDVDLDGVRPSDAVIESASISLGSVAPTIIFAEEAMQYLSGRKLDEVTINHAAELAAKAAAPIDDVRSSSAYRSEVVRVCVKRCLQTVSDGEEAHRLSGHAPLLWGKRTNGIVHPIHTQSTHSRSVPAESPIVTRINGKEYTFTSGYHKTLLRLLREEAGLVGTKEGCAEGECGACTVFLDGVAVMSCLVPAPRAHGAEIVTIEGIAKEGELHPVQQAFIDDGAVQCGYCTPGFIMSAVKLLEEQPHPDRDSIKQALTGNLCRCTGYYKIVQAIEHASQNGGPS
ncbi:MAG: hypothetical protein EHM41_13525 [Chloroflexi bacterium]|nr:MAG: hypothetical protein EHM41_13525 [Chloroflexota bacterium]